MALVRSRRQNADAAATRFDFTLLELLITVAIVALLAGMVLPALNRARDQAREITCAGSLKQLSAAHAQYAQASDDFTVPPAVKWEWWKYWPGNPLFRSLLGLESAFYQSREEYEASYPVFPRGMACGKAVRAQEPDLQGRRGNITYSYGINAEQAGGEVPSGYAGFKLSRIKAPSGLMAYADGLNARLSKGFADPRGNYWKTGEAAGSFAIPYRHRSRTALNAAFQDGHVAETHWEQVRDNDIFWVDKRAFVFRD
ncbi:type II secretion system protein [Victivallis vadensis]|uniref:type II secretion system protein n=1 Tax=Victivallis vadensis TaxID=172901 RepID=UPI00266BB724|nr:type II secretion system protein [Victivallis vadensis]